MDESSNPLFTFGLIADIQYCEKDDAYNHIKTKIRYYRNSICLLQDATRKWASEVIQPTFILQLGDLIDGYNVQYKTTETSLEKVLTEIERLKIPVHHIWGNHEFYNFTRKQLFESRLNTTQLMGSLTTSPEKADRKKSFYAYHFSPFPKFRVLLIDCYDFSVIGRDPSSRQHTASLKLLRQKNSNEDLNSPEGNAEVQFVQFNGGISAEQLHWINQVLENADKNQEKVMVTGHLPIHPDSTDPICLTWNYQEVLSMLQAHPCVVTYFAGHDHDGGYCRDSSGIHHITFNGIIETPPDSQAFGTMYVYGDRMVLHGVGLVPNLSLPYRKI